jgi:hypothetical protein
VKRHLDRDLKDRGVMVNREVEIRRPMGGAPGERTDIHVTVAVPTADSGVWEKVTAVIEVKGIWNRELVHAMESQLAERYLKETGFGYGLYLVGWFACPQWDSKDRRSEVQPYPSISDAEEAFDKQAVSLSKFGSPPESCHSERGAPVMNETTTVKKNQRPGISPASITRLKSVVRRGGLEPPRDCSR